MSIEIREESPPYLNEHARIPAAFEVTSVFDVAVRDGGLGGFTLTERELSTHFVKDYDAIPHNAPTEWLRTFDVSKSGLLSAHRDGLHLGGALIATCDASAFRQKSDDSDFAVLWDLRVAPAARRRGIASALFAAAQQWARVRGFHQLEIETQNTNLPACRFYAKYGCELEAIRRFAYPAFPEEVQFLRRLSLEPASRDSPSPPPSHRPN